jgi:two-component system response regulator QseB
MESAGKRSGQAGVPRRAIRPFYCPRLPIQARRHCRATQYRRLGGEAPVIIVIKAKAIEVAPDVLDAGANDYFANRLSWGNCPCEYRHGPVGTELTGALSVRAGWLNSTRLLATQARTAGGVHLSSREFTLLQALLEEPNRVFSRAELEQRLYKRGEAIRSKAVEVHAHYLRRKVGNDEIITIRGNGYRLRMLAWKSLSV